MRKGLSILLVVHGLITFAAGVLLSVAPGLIPSAMGIRWDSQSNLLAYLLAGAEFGFATLSLGGSRLQDPHALRVIAWSCVVFHAASGALELLAYAQGARAAVLANVVARVVICVLFLFFARRPAKLAEAAPASPIP